MPGVAPRVTPSASPAFGRFRALVVDDERVIRSLLRRALARSEFDVAEAGNGRSALEIFRPGLFGLVFGDVQMRFMGGIELLRQLKVQQPDLPVVLVSGNFEPKSGPSDADLEAYALLKKPLSIDTIQRTALAAVNVRTEVTPRSRIGIVCC
jgi:DNA-binding NtrC family response regulator